MSKALLIIDIGRDSVKGCLLTSGNGDGKVCTETPLKGELKAALNTLIKDLEGAGRGACSRVILGLPAEVFSLRVVEVPITDREKVEEILPFELSERLVKGTEEFIFEASAMAGGRTMAVALEKTVMREYLGILRDLGLEPFMVSCALLCKDKLLGKVNSAEAPAAFLDNESIVISDGWEPLLYKKVSSDVDVKLALASLESVGVEIKTFYCCGTAAEALVPPGREVCIVKDWDERFTGVSALALQVSERARGTVNFRKGEFADTEALERARKGFKVTALLVLLVALLWGGLVTLQSRRLSARAGQMKKDIRLSYQEAFPAESAVGDPSYQLEIKLKEQSKDMGLMGRGVGVLDNLRLLAKAGGAAGVTLYHLSMSGQRVTAKGKAPSFEKAAQFKDELIKLKAFRAPALTDVKTSIGGGVTFSVALDINRKGASSGLLNRE
ncbi:MAG: type II secretion system protein GspL [Thermodesulfobacteriota bacterium]